LLKLFVNGEHHELEIDPSMPLLWALRDVLGLSATKYGCGIGQCGACTVHIDGEPVRSCLRPVGSIDGSEVTTFESLQSREGRGLREEWLRLQVPQCGYCQGGMIMACAALRA
jgi:isoquinoline 1-oxidoreductase alpha subunit